MAIVIVVVGFVAVVIFVPKLSSLRPGGGGLSDPVDRATAESDFRGHLLQAIGGLVLAATACITWATFRLNRKKQDSEREERMREFELIRENQNAERRARTTELELIRDKQDTDREGQITERFTRAVEQLADRDKLDIRLGGIYALERIARDSSSHYEPVMEVLTAFMREHARWRPDGGAAPDSAALPEDAPRQARRRPRADFQAVAKVLGDRNRDLERDQYHLVLRWVDLRGVTLRGAQLQEARLENAHLEGADLRGAKLQGAHLQLTHLEKAELDWDTTRLDGAQMQGVHLEGATLTRAHLERADLSTREEGGDRFEAHLEGADLRWASLDGANLSEAHLEGADLSGATGLTQSQLAKAFTDANTTLPEYLREADASRGRDRPR